MLSQLKTRWTIHRADLGADFTAAFTTGVASIPDSMASALLAGISPLTGLYTMIVATPIGALFTSSEMMHVSTTSALSLAVGSSLLGVPPASRLQSVFLLAFMVGVIQIGMGLLKMGFLVRFVPHSVMTGFLNGVALLIILGQLTDFTGYDSPLSNRVAQALDTLLNLREVVLPVLLVGLLMVALIILLGRTRRLRAYAFVLAMLIASLTAALPVFDVVPLVGDVTEVPNALPRFSLPDFSLALGLIVPAFALSIIGMVQGAGISQGYPNPDGKFPDPSGDFLGQGAANLVAGFFKGMPCGGSLSGTAMVVSAGARSRWANVLVGILIAVIVLLFGGLVERIAMPALAGLLIVIGYRTINPEAIRTVWQTGTIPRVVMVTTFLGTLIMPLQFAVYLGVVLSVLLFVFQQANRIRLVELVPGEGGFPIERPAPRQLPGGQVTILYPYGSLFYAAARTFEENLPVADQAHRAAVVFVFRGYDEFGSTMISVLERYTSTVQKNGGRILLAGIGPDVLAQFERTGIVALVGRESIFPAQIQWGIAANQAVEAARSWLEAAP